MYFEDLIVIVDDETEITASYEIFLKRNGYKNYKTYNSPVEFRSEINSMSPAVVFLDLRMPVIGGEELLNEITGIHKNTSVFIVSGTEDVATAVRCIKNGALDYLVKPIDKDRLATAIIKGCEICRIKSELVSIKVKMSGDNILNDPAFSEIITADQGMANLFGYLRALAKTDETVLITGETGTGKELIAHAVHKSSGRTGAYIPVNVSALDENMFNDTLFGHKKGAFTNADKDRAGLLATAHNGTIFLDEIGDLSESSQIKLLRILQNRQYMPVGSDKPLTTTARIIAATNADLKKKSDDGSFRRDLYYRLTAHQIAVPPLRKRNGDIEYLTGYFYSRELKKIGETPAGLPVELTAYLKNHDFPGNVRELESIVRDFVIVFGSADVSEKDTAAFLKLHGVNADAGKKITSDKKFCYNGDFPSIKYMEQMLIDEALSQSGGNQSKAAAMLGISRQALNKRLKN
jgi:DNA-binding NtrC family response regulator